ncbi:glycosyltransferase [Nocardia pseudobrasiliensis]|uniref:Glycosyltransferase involved in cell wall biosynthesis n=1 Tax=Nocardia pseudobrasiliensis TaxID=45979 RepID=A0A370I719_9NOCA|nr:glycosyltransferase [Nocardia pseudobrasiliensis]RDI65901.1 glycosyltransferase involved in cell wall biosynthesis [Nocardia pseudobrasiliensis]
MRIGLFTDTYHPATNGIVYAVDITRRQLRRMGHDVYVFCPKVVGEEMEYDPRVVRFRSVASGLFEDSRVSLFRPSAASELVRGLDLDVIHFFTPAQLGLLAVHTARTTGAVLIGHHCTDISRVVEHYRHTLPVLLSLALALQFAIETTRLDLATLATVLRPRSDIGDWCRIAAENSLAMLYSRCDAVVAVSRKSRDQLESWRGTYDYRVVALPTGVDPLPSPSPEEIARFRSQWNLADDEEIIVNVGRMGAEKNLPLLIAALRIVLEARPRARLMYVGGFDFLNALKELAAQSGVGHRITFTGCLPRNRLGVVYAVADVLAFPSMTDTQGLVLNEAANAGLPIVLIDESVTEIVRHGVNGVVTPNSATGFAAGIIELLADRGRADDFGAAGRRIAREFGEYGQTRKLELLYRQEIAKRRRSRSLR